MKNIVIGGAWPYANGSLHIGHIAALLPGDILARYYRAKGDSVYYVSGSDCHGTPITIRAIQEKSTPQEISERYHAEFYEVFKKLGFSYDLYTKTSDTQHKEFVREFHEKLYQGRYIEERTVKQAYCPTCNKSLTDRLVLGICPSCGKNTRGDQCDYCNEILEADLLSDAKCSECGTKVNFFETTQLFLKISELEKELKEFLDLHSYWRKNAIAFTKRYIDEGLRDRAITRDLDWGIDIPKSGFENKKIYIWAENVLGYLSAVESICKERNTDFTQVFGENARHYYIHGKDNIPFHTIILPSLLLAHGEGLRLPDDIISSEHMTLEGRKISTSQNWAVWAKDLINEYNPDTIRYFFIVNGPEKRDTDFSWREFAERNNSDLVGVWGNFVNRTFAFSVKYLDGEISGKPVCEELRLKTQAVYKTVGESIQKGCFKDAIKEIFELVRDGNKYYDTNEPWKTRNYDIEECKETIFNCAYLIANIAVLLRPFLPFSSDKICKWLSLGEEWHEHIVSKKYISQDFSVLFSRI